MTEAEVCVQLANVLRKEITFDLLQTHYPDSSEFFRTAHRYICVQFFVTVRHHPVERENRVEAR